MNAIARAILRESEGERAAATLIRWAGLPKPEREYRFHPKRQWRLDFAWPDLLIAMEVEGGAYAGGRHVRGTGFEADAAKYNEAAVRGWMVLRVTPRMLDDGTAMLWLKRAIEGRRS